MATGDAEIGLIRLPFCKDSNTLMKPKHSIETNLACPLYHSLGVRFGCFKSLIYASILNINIDSSTHFCGKLKNEKSSELVYCL